MYIFFRENSRQNKSGKSRIDTKQLGSVALNLDNAKELGEAISSFSKPKDGKGKFFEAMVNEAGENEPINGKSEANK